MACLDDVGCRGEAQRTGHGRGLATYVQTGLVHWMCDWELWVTLLHSISQAGMGEGVIRRVGRRDFGTCRAACQWLMTHDGMMRGARGGVDCRPQWWEVFNT